MLPTVVRELSMRAFGEDIISQIRDLLEIGRAEEAGDFASGF